MAIFQFFAYHEEDCEITSDNIAALSQVQSIENCLAACKLVQGCQYYTYHMGYKECNLYEGGERTCSATVGPASPTYEECQTPQPTTEVPSTSTSPLTTSTPPVPGIYAANYAVISY